MRVPEHPPLIQRMLYSRVKQMVPNGSTVGSIGNRVRARDM